MCAGFEREARPQAVALLGWAGGLLDHLAVGDIVIADQALSATDSGVDCVRLELPGLPRVHCGPMLTTGHVLATPEAKHSAGRSGALAVEMEAYPLAAWAAKHKVPFVHGRVILDRVDEALPELDRVLDGYGQLQIRPLLGALGAGRPCWASSLGSRPAYARPTGALPSWQWLLSRALSPSTPIDSPSVLIRSEILTATRWVWTSSTLGRGNRSSPARSPLSRMRQARRTSRLTCAVSGRDSGSPIERPDRHMGVINWK